MPTSGWKRLLAGMPWFGGEGKYPIAAYSEFIPPPRLGPKPYGAPGPEPFAADDSWGWQVTEYEEGFQLRPGLACLAGQFVGALAHLGRGERAHGIARGKLRDNPYWPPELDKRAGSFGHERYLVLLPLALSRTQDDKGRLRWTLFGGSEQGPARAFWKSFYTAPGREAPEEQGLDFFRRLLGTAYGEAAGKVADLRAAGFRILPGDAESGSPGWEEGPLPGWTAGLRWRKGERGVKYLLTFRPFGELPAGVQQAYVAGELHLLPFPGSLLFWGIPSYAQLREELPFAAQIPLLHTSARHEDPHGIRVPQSGWMHEPRAGETETEDSQHGPMRNTFKRTHRWLRVYRHEDELAVVSKEDKLAHVLFSTAPDDLGLYGKPMARNVQLWTEDFRLLLDGPRAAAEEIDAAARQLRAGGLFGYRFQYPALRVGRHEVYWHRPLVAYLSAQTGRAEVLPDAPLGYLTAYRADRPDLDQPIELWPRLLGREPYVTALEIFDHAHDFHQFRTALNVRKLLDARYLFGGQPVPDSFARQLLACPKGETLDAWLDALPERSSDPERGRHLVEELRRGISPTPPAAVTRTLPEALTYERTARRSFEVNYWNTIRTLAHGLYVNKDNADCVLDPTTLSMLNHYHRDLEALGDYLLDYYRRTIAAARMTGKALAGDLPFVWRTDFKFPWMGGWLNNQEQLTHERDLIVVIPGRDRRRAVIMADHYDTAYMADHYEKQQGGNGARLAAAGADDNHSATAALMLGAPVFLELSRAGRLGCDIWLIHLTGEEFPSDCLGARHLCQWLVEGTLRMRLPDGKGRDLSKARIQGLYVLDMVAHNNTHDRDVFQIAPGTGRESAWLAYQAHIANEIWNAGVPSWNGRASRRNCQRGRRSADGWTLPATALHPQLSGEVRLPYDPRSTLYNTDGQIFSDAGVPAVLFMENYDINRTGYHDSHDTMENIDLDYGAGVAAIAIESVARAATEEAPF